MEEKATHSLQFSAQLSFGTVFLPVVAMLASFENQPIVSSLAMLTFTLYSPPTTTIRRIVVDVCTKVEIKPHFRMAFSCPLVL